MTVLLWVGLGFLLGAMPFSVWLGLLIVNTDIRHYGDGNPGAVNVFRAGGRKAGYFATLLDLAKGVPFVFMAHSLFKLPEAAVMLVALSAILGHAFSPLLQLRGGKSIAVSFGVLFALPQHEIVVTFAAFLVLGILFIETHAWVVILGTAGTLAYITVTGANPWQSLFIFSVLIVFAIKHFGNLQTVPRFKVKLISWLQSRRRET